MRENIEAVLRLENEYLSRRTTADRLADRVARFVGSLWFVVLHLLLFGLWAAVNLGILKVVKPFDPYPFQLLTMILTMEGVLLATFVLIKQNRLGELGDRRAHMNLQVNLLAEHEVTRLLRLTGEIARHLGLPADGIGELTEDTEVEELAGALDREMSERNGRSN